MKLIITLFSATMISSASSLVAAPAFYPINEGIEVLEHGGGCRKNSPAGQCCHMDRKKGTVHCH